jgi:hypothetical protein
VATLPDVKPTREEVKSLEFILQGLRQVRRDGGYGTMTIRIKDGRVVEQTTSVTYLAK